jgi:hypothetical protein
MRAINWITSVCIPKAVSLLVLTAVFLSIYAFIVSIGYDGYLRGVSFQKNSISTTGTVIAKTQCGSLKAPENCLEYTYNPIQALSASGRGGTFTGEEGVEFDVFYTTRIGDVVPVVYNAKNAGEVALNENNSFLKTDIFDNFIRQFVLLFFVLFGLIYGIMFLAVLGAYRKIARGIPLFEVSGRR